MFDLSGKVAAVTGAAKGIGEAIAETFATAGATVYLIDVDGEGVEIVASRISGKAGNGGKARAIKCDVADQEMVQETFDQIADGAGRLDLLVNNAGIAHIGTVTDTEEEDFERVFSVNAKGVYNCLKAGIPQMQKLGGGAIVNMASAAAVSGVPERFAYSMSKGAALTMTYSVAIDYIEDGIRCNAIAPSRVHTPFVEGFVREHYPGQEAEVFAQLEKKHPIGRLAQPEEVAALALYLCSDEASFVTGCLYPFDGGYLHLKPGG